MGFKVGFEDERAVDVGPVRCPDWLGRLATPMTVLGTAKERGETGVAIEPWPTQPVDGARARYQSRSFAVADDCVVLDPGKHSSLLLKHVVAGQVWRVVSNFVGRAAPFVAVKVRRARIGSCLRTSEHALCIWDQESAAWQKNSATST
jgi:hypothetical protein